MERLAWFDPANEEHLNAFKTVDETGLWPKGFLDDKKPLPVGWMGSMRMKIVDHFFKQREAKDQVTLVLLEDWTGLYVNGRLQAQNSTLPITEVLEALGYKDVEVKEIENYPDSWLPPTLLELEK